MLQMEQVQTATAYTPAAITATTYFRRKDMCGTGELSYSNAVVVKVYQHLVAGTITPGGQSQSPIIQVRVHLQTTAANGGICSLFILNNGNKAAMVLFLISAAPPPAAIQPWQSDGNYLLTVSCLIAGKPFIQM